MELSSNSFGASGDLSGFLRLGQSMLVAAAATNEWSDRCREWKQARFWLSQYQMADRSVGNLLEIGPPACLRF